VEIVLNTATDLIRFDWGVLDPAYGENAFAADGEGNRASKGFTLSYAELAEAVSCPAGDAAVAVVDESGAQTEHPDATVNRDGSITFRKVGTAGESTFRFALTVGGKVYGPASVTVYTYGVADSTYLSPDDTVYNTDKEGLFAPDGTYYSLQEVDDSYFADALMIGDSRTVGLYEYGDMADVTSFLARESSTIYDLFDDDEKMEYTPRGKESREQTLKGLLTKAKFKKIYISVGVNELGVPDTKDYYH
jgi:hypothetical protein